MNKTISIALAGFSFIIEEQAYTKLNNYLNALRSTLEQEEADEVMYDIEIRITEILKESLGKREVVNDDDVEKVIAQIGTPEAIGEQEEFYSTKEEHATKTKEQKKLFRDVFNKKIAGVCAGLAYYFGMEVGVMRAIWAGLLLLGIVAAVVPASLVLALYVLLWIAIPSASTPTDFLKMKGKPIDFDSIKEESIRFANNYGQKAGAFYQENKGKWEDIGNVIRKVMGWIFAILAAKFFIIMLLGIFGVYSDTKLMEFREVEFLFDEQQYVTIIYAMIVLAFSIPIILCAAISQKLFAPKSKIRYHAIVLGFVFIGLIGLGAYFGVEMSKKEMIYAGRNEEKENIAIKSANETIELGIKKVEIPEQLTPYDNGRIYSDKKRVFDKESISIDVIRKTNIQEPYLIITKEAKGYNKNIKVNVPVEVMEGKINLPNYIIYPYEERFRDYDVDYELIIPSHWRVINNGGKHLNIYEENEDYDKDIDIEYHNGGIHIETPKDTIKVQRS